MRDFARHPATRRPLMLRTTVVSDRLLITNKTVGQPQGAIGCAAHNVSTMPCPVCGVRKARRSCPALGQQICAICCGTKRLVEINCPSDCVYLLISQQHPPAVALRRQQIDVGLLVHGMRDLNQQQSRVFFAVISFVAGYEPPEFQPLLDEDVGASAAAMAATLETAERGVIYEHRPSSLPAERLLTGLKAILDEGIQRGGSVFQRDAALVLRRIEEMTRDLAEKEPANRRAFVELIGRAMKKTDSDPEAARDRTQAPRLIVP